MARLYLAVGQYSKAEQTALQGTRWKNEDVKRLDLSEINLVTLGEVYLAKGKYPLAIEILERAKLKARKAWRKTSAASLPALSEEKRSMQSSRCR